MKNYIRLMLGKKSVHADECRKDGFIGIDFGVHRDLSKDLPEDWREFNSKYIPETLAAHPDKTKIAAGLAGGAVWTVAKWLKTGDVVLCPEGSGKYTVEDASAFAMEEHLEAFLIANWNQTELSREYDIFAEDGEATGRQYRTDTGPLDILCVSKAQCKLAPIEVATYHKNPVELRTQPRAAGQVRIP